MTRATLSRVQGDLERPLGLRHPLYTFYKKKPLCLTKLYFQDFKESAIHLEGNWETSKDFEHGWGVAQTGSTLGDYKHKYVSEEKQHFQ